MIARCRGRRNNSSILQTIVKTVYLLFFHVESFTICYYHHYSPYKSILGNSKLYSYPDIHSKITTTLVSDESTTTKKYILKPKNNGTNKSTSIHLISFPFPYHQQQGSNDFLASHENDNQNLNESLHSLYRWKKYTLGDGGVYFDQRPKTLQLLNIVLATKIVDAFRDKMRYDQNLDNNNTQEISQTLNTDWDIECATLSTCARFEVFVAITTKHYSSSNKSQSMSDLNSSSTAFNISEFYQHPTNKLIESTIANCLAEQIVYSPLSNNLITLIGCKLKSRLQRIRNKFRWKAKGKHGRSRLASFMTFIGTSLPFLSLLDKPTRIYNCTTSNVNITSSPRLSNRYFHEYQQVRKKELSDTLMKILQHSYHNYDIIRHICLLASGMRPYRTSFQPDSSRDAHVLHQIKQCSDGCVSVKIDQFTNAPPYETIHPSKKSIAIIFNAALEAGKASRNGKIVPLLQTLRFEKEKYTIIRRQNEQPLDLDGNIEKINHESLLYQVENSAYELAVKPVINNTVRRFEIMQSNTSDLISELNWKVRLFLLERFGIDLNDNIGDTENGMNNYLLDDKNKSYNYWNVGYTDENKLRTTNIIKNDILKQQIRRRLKQLLHKPIIDLREGNEVDLDALLELIEVEINTLCEPP